MEREQVSVSQWKPLGTLLDYHAKHPDGERQFHCPLASTQSISIYDPIHLARGYDWTQDETIVDVSSSIVALSSRIHEPNSNSYLR